MFSFDEFGLERTKEHEIDIKISKDPMSDLVRQEQADQLLFERICSDDEPIEMLIYIRKYGVVWNNEISADQQHWFPYSVSMSLNDFTLDERKQEIINRNSLKLLHTRVLEISFCHQQRYEAHLTISMLSQLHQLQLTQLNLSFECRKGLEVYSMEILAEFIASQHSLEILQLSNTRISFNLDKTQILGLAINSVKQLKKIRLTFLQCPDLTDPMVKGLFREIDNMPMLDTIILSFRNCEGIMTKTREDLQDMASN